MAGMMEGGAERRSREGAEEQRQEKRRWALTIAIAMGWGLMVIKLLSGPPEPTRANAEVEA
eukprot:134779-Hanusia_phi.AAC.6